MKRGRILLNVVILAVAFGMDGVANSAPMGTGFTYQGRLADANSPAEGLYDFQFKLYDSTGQVGGDINQSDVDVIDGYFTVELDFGADAFIGVKSWLEIGIRPGELEDPNEYTPLSPRQELTPTPHAIYAENAGSDNDWAVSGDDIYSIPSGNVGIGTTTPAHKLEVKAPTNQALRLSTESTNSHVDIQGTPTGSGSMRLNVFGGANAITFNVNNTEKVRMNSNGDVGIGTASPGARLEVNGQVKITGGSPGADKVLTSDAGGLATWQTPSATADSDWQVSGVDMYSLPSGNVGIGTTSPAAKLDVSGDIGTASVYKIGGSTVLSVTGTNNTLVGVGAGVVNTGTGNTFLGNWAGYSNTTGYRNTFLGYQAGNSNTTGDYNTFSGYQAGNSNTTGNSNTFSGYRAGRSNTIGYYNTFLGNYAGYNNTEGYYNTFLGNYAGYNNTTGDHNTFSGYQAGYSNTTGGYNTFLGNYAGYNNTTGSGNVFLGYRAGYSANGSNKLYIANSDVNTLIYGDFSTGRVGIGTSAVSNSKLEVYTDSDPYGIYSENAMAAGTRYGLYGLASGNNTSVSYGVLGRSSSTTGTNRGVYGRATAASTGTNYGVYGWAYNDGSGDAWAGYFSGDGYFSGNVSIGATLVSNRCYFSGTVGIGTPSPEAPLHIAGGNWDLTNTEGDFKIGNSTYRLKIGIATGGGGAGSVGIRSHGGTGNLILGSNTTEVLMVQDTGGGRVGIGTMSPNGTLDVNGSIYQRGGVLHADYVFESDYNLESIEEHADYMWTNKHLPAIPKAKTDETGREIVEVGAHRKGIVEELEKAHIYIAQLHQRLERLEAKLAEVKDN